MSAARHCDLMGPELLGALVALVAARDSAAAGPVIAAALRVADALGMDHAETADLVGSIIAAHAADLEAEGVAA